LLLSPVSQRTFVTTKILYFCLILVLNIACFFWYAYEKVIFKLWNNIFFFFKLQKNVNWNICYAIILNHIITVKRGNMEPERLSNFSSGEKSFSTLTFFLFKLCEFRKLCLKQNNVAFRSFSGLMRCNLLSYCNVLRCMCSETIKMSW